MRLYPQETLEQFEFDKIRQWVAEYCRNPKAAQKALKMNPLENKDLCLVFLNQTHEYANLLRSAAFFPPHQFPDISKEVELIRIQNSMLVEKQFLAIREVSEIANALLRYFGEKAGVLPMLNLILAEIYHTPDIIKAIDKVIDQNAEVRSTASTRLASIRRDLSARRRELEKLFNAQVQKYRKLGYLAETEETVANGHRVLSVLAEYKKVVKGMMVGSSDTGKTTFIEPIETLDLNNEVFELEQEEKREVISILKNLTSELRPFKDLIKNYEQALVLFDFVRAKALLAVELNAHLPFLSAKPAIRLLQARHPLLYLQNKKAGKETIPLNIDLDQQKRILVISGPNSGGKSISLKTVGLLQIMLQAGLLVPCKENSEMGFFDFLLTDIGDSQSIENELSTYSSRLVKMRKFVDLAGKTSLCLIDEFGTGSDPELGGAIAEAILEDISSKKSFAIITTHYLNIKLAADRLPGVINGCMLFDENTLQPLYQLSVGQPGSSYTFLVAEKIGLHKHIINQAKQKVNSESLKLDTLLTRLQKDKSSIAKQLHSLQSKQERAEQAKTKYDELFERYKDLMERRKSTREDDQKLMELGRKLRILIHEFEHSKDKKTVFKKFSKTAQDESMRKVERKKQEENAKLSEAQIAAYKKVLKPGVKVTIYKGKQIGVVESIEKTKAHVIFGAVKSIVDLKSLVPVLEDKA